MWLWRIILALLIIILAEYYFIKKVTNAAKFLFPSLNGNKRKKWTIVFLIIINLYPLYLLADWGYSAIGGKMIFIPESSLFDYLIIFPFWIWIFLVTQSILIFLLLDIIKLFLFPLYKKFKEKLRRGEAKFVIVLVAFFIIYIPARVLYDYYTISIRITEYKNSSLPAALNNFRLVFISDIHADEFTNDARLEKFVKKVNSTNPDLVLIGGDFISSTPDYIETAATFIGKIKSKYGIYSCVGDHDNWAYRNDTRRSLKEIMQCSAEA